MASPKPKRKSAKAKAAKATKSKSKSQAATAPASTDSTEGSGISSGIPAPAPEVKEDGRHNNPGRVENLTPWQPGQSGNPAGRSRRQIFQEAYDHVLLAATPQNLKEHIDKLIEQGAPLIHVVAYAMAAQIIKGNVLAAIEMRKATDGDKVSSEHTVSLLTPEELEQKRQERWKVVAPILASLNITEESATDGT
jgi:hypothetical protein